MSGWHMTDSKTRHRSHQRQHHNNAPEHDLLLEEKKRHHPAADRSENDGQKRQRLQHTIPARELLGGQDLGHNAVLRGDKEGGLHPHEEDGAEHQPRAKRLMAMSTQPEAQRRQQGDADLDDLPADQRVSLGVAISQIAGDRAEDGPRGIEENRHQRDSVPLGKSLGVDGEKHRRNVNGLIVERAEKLGHEQPDKRAVGQAILGPSKSIRHTG